MLDERYPTSGLNVIKCLDKTQNNKGKKYKCSHQLFSAASAF
jgi:hypothetical protein